MQYVMVDTQLVLTPIRTAAVVLCTVSLLLTATERQARADDMSAFAGPLIAIVAFMAIAGGGATIAADVANIVAIARRERSRTVWIVLGLVLGGIESAIGADAIAEDPGPGLILLGIGLPTFVLAIGSLAMPSSGAHVDPDEPEHESIPMPSFGVE